MQKIKGSILLVLGMIMAYSCYYEYPPQPLPIDPDQVSFNTHILPLLVTKCSTPQCHDGTKAPNLLADQAYNSLRSGGYLNLTYPEQSLLYVSIDQGVGGIIMPPSGELSQLDKDLFLVWMAKGAPND